MRRQTVEALRTAVRAREQQIADCARGTAVAVVERMQRDEPEMAESGLDQRRHLRGRVDPGEKARQLRFETRRGRRFEVHMLTPDRPRHDLHRTGGIVTPGADANRREAGVTGRKQRGVPAEQAFARDRKTAGGRRVEHHFHDAFHMPIDACERANVHAQTPRDRRAHRDHAQTLALDFAGLQHVLGERREARLIAQAHADIRETAHQHALSAARLGHGLGERRHVEAPLGPVASLPDIGVFAAIHAVIMARIRRTHNLFAAHYAANKPAIHRTPKQKPRSRPP
ncbi:hypothetical protein PT2222_310052 [Paraburkholderia tropica]